MKLGGGQKLRIVYLQYTNPASYPPLEHSSEILAKQGCEILFLGGPSDGSKTLTLSRHPAIRVRQLPAFGQRLMQALNYIVYLGWTLATCIIWRPRWIYASDHWACMPSFLIQKITGCS